MLPTTQTLLVFAASTFALLVVPGPSVVYVMTRSIEQGRGAGLMAMLGLETGALLHAVAAATGLASLLAASSVAFSTIKWTGAAYLVYLAVRQFRLTSPDTETDRGVRTSSRGRLFRDGVLVDLLNPKTCIFFIAFLPQFVDESRGPAPTQMLALGLCFVVLAGLCDGTYALVSGGIGGRIGQSPRLQGRVNRATGGVYVLLAVVAVSS
ncbi:LysE family translocator [Solicola gregarius]|uniref:LysE family translocator n=1 Tax=Solicola gregarius TaxID=2908642 RepID=A0AA46TK64_9ACTN|nr:LysE family translocator [Solicola gregarius]UYM06811.1 LysE family translocator [Solicola gregarius]